jgi:peptidoglycan/LPS O-acetylase OafA/YrhL
VCSWKALRFYGKYSYGLYLLHYWFSRPFRAMQYWIGQHVPIPLVAGFLGFALILLCSTLLAMASFRWIEQPFLRLKGRFAD